MPVTLTKEDGTALTDSNSYADVDDGNDYHESSLYAPEWAAATPNRKAQALVSATRLLDGEMQFNGYKRRQEQSLQWPRRLCPDPDSDTFDAWWTFGGAYANPIYQGNYLPETSVPKLVIDCTCELAGRLLQSNRAADPREATVGSGVKEFELANSIRVEFATGKDVQEGFVAQPLPRDVLNLLSKYGRPVGAGSGSVKLRRA